MSKSEWFNNRAEENIDRKTDMALYMMLKAIYYKLCEVKEEKK